MPSKQFGLPLPDVVPERDSRVVHYYAEHLEGLGLSSGMTGAISTASHMLFLWVGWRGFPDLFRPVWDGSSHVVLT